MACKSLQSVNIPRSIKQIDDYTFDGCKSLKSINLPDGIKSIGEYAFSECYSLENIDLPNSVESIGDGAFDECILLDSITMPIRFKGEEKRLCIDKNCSITYIEENSTQQELVNAVFDDAGFIIEDGVLIKYKDNEFFDVEIPDNVTSIGREAFYESTIYNIIIPDSVQSIGSFAFNSCDFLNKVFIPASVKHIGIGAFGSCENLDQLEVAKDNPYYYSENNCIIERKSKTLIAGCNKSKIPDNIKRIETYALAFCEEFYDLVIPSGIESIGEKAFYCCENLESIVLPNSVTHIEDKAFEYCYLLNKITLPSRFEGEEERLGIDEDCEIIYTDDNPYSKNIR